MTTVPHRAAPPSTRTRTMIDDVIRVSDTAKIADVDQFGSDLELFVAQRCPALRGAAREGETREMDRWHQGREVLLLEFYLCCVFSPQGGSPLFIGGRRRHPPSNNRDGTKRGGSHREWPGRPAHVAQALAALLALSIRGKWPAPMGCPPGSPFKVGCLF
jgi:hypothetical protein